MAIEKFITDVKELKWKTSIGHSLYVIIPKAIRDRIELQQGDHLRLIIEKVSLEIKCKHGNAVWECNICETG